MSNPFAILIVIGLMLLAGWLVIGDLTPLLWGVAIGYLILSIIGGHLAKRSKQGSQEG